MGVLPLRPSPAAVGHAARRTTAGVTALMLGSTLLTACGQAGTAGSDSPREVSIGVAGNVFDVPLRVADARGYFAQHGLRVKFVTVTSATGTPSLESGSLQFLNSSPTSFLGAIAKGMPEVAVGADGLGNPLGLVVSKSFAQQHGLTSRSSPDEAAKALAGSTGGSSSANTRAEAEMFLKNGKVDLHSIKWVSLPSPSADKDALVNDRIDWFVTSEPLPLPLQIQHDGDGTVVANSLIVPEWGGFYAGYEQVVVTRRNYADKNSDTVSKFMAAVREGIAYLEKHADDPQTIRVAEEVLPGVPVSVVAASVKEVQWPLFAHMQAETWRRTFKFVSELDALPPGAKITLSDWTNDYLG
ncbi:ABC transporter substrate-binding protein [Streptomyces sp. NPDC001443]